MKKCFKTLTFSVVLLIINKMMLAQHLIYKETFGVPSGQILLGNYTDFDVMDINYYCKNNTATVRSTSPSDTAHYELASGGGNVFLSNSNESLYIEKIPISSYENIILGLGIRKERTAALAEDIQVRVVVDNDTSDALFYDFPVGPGTVKYYWLQSDLGFIPEGDSLSILIDNLSESSFRIDDIHLWAKDEALPILLANFELNIKPNALCFIWKTLKEEQVQSFVIEISDEGSYFREFYRMIPKNASNGSTYEYCYKDITMLKGKKYFRLKSEDWDGSATYSEVLVWENRNADIILPNILRRGNFFEGFESNNLKVLRVWSLDGRKVYNSSANTNFFFKIPDLLSGLYIVEVMDRYDKVHRYKIQIVE